MLVNIYKQRNVSNTNQQHEFRLNYQPRKQTASRKKTKTIEGKRTIELITSYLALLFAGNKGSTQIILFYASIFLLFPIPADFTQ